MTEALLRQIASQYGFDDWVMLDPLESDALSQDVETLMVMICPYDPSDTCEQDGSALIHPYYPASQRAYRQAKEMAADLTEQGIPCIHLPNAPLKQILSRAPGFIQRKNTLIYTKEYGSRFHIQCIGLKNRPQTDRTYNKLRSVWPNCGKCTRCMEACPTGAVSANGVDAAKCLRHHMLSGKEMPEAIRKANGNRLLGCDICQQVCPFNASLISVNDPDLALPVKELLFMDQQLLDQLKETLGANLAIKNRLIAQALIVAGNSTDETLIDMLTGLAAHPSPVIRAHAQWAVTQLIHQTKEQNKNIT